MLFQCSKCSHNFGQKDLLKRHVSAVHEKIIFRCSTCNQRFGQKNLLNTHIRCVHEQKTHYSVVFIAVLSDSMEPAFHRGDVVYLPYYKQEDIRVGETIALKVKGRDIPIVHRVLNLHENAWNCIQIHETALKRMRLHEIAWNCMKLNEIA